MKSEKKSIKKKMSLLTKYTNVRLCTGTESAIIDFFISIILLFRQSSTILYLHLRIITVTAEKPPPGCRVRRNAIVGFQFCCITT